MPVGHHVAHQRLVEVGANSSQVDFPEPLFPIDHGVRTPDAVDQQVQTPRFPSHAGSKARHFLFVRVVDSNGDGPATSPLYERHRFVDRFRSIHAFRMTH